MKSLKSFLLSNFLGVDEVILNKTNQKTGYLIIFSFLTIISFPVILFFVFRNIFHDIYWFYNVLISLICSLPLYNIFTFSYISWRKSSILAIILKTKTSLLSSISSYIVRFSFVGLIILFISSTSFTFFSNEKIKSEILEHKSKLITDYSNNINNNIDIEKIYHKKDISNINSELDIIKTKLSDTDDEINHVFYSKRFKALDSIILAKEDEFNHTIDSLSRENYAKIESYKFFINKNTFFFKRMSKATSQKSFIFYTILIVLTFFVFSYKFYKNFVSTKSIYFKYDIALQKEILLQENNPIIDHTVLFLKKIYNYNYTPTISALAKDGLDLKFYMDKKVGFGESVTTINDKNDLIQKLKGGL